MAHTYQTQKRRQMLGNETSIVNKLTVSNPNNHSIQ